MQNYCKLLKLQNFFRFFFEKHSFLTFSNVGGRLIFSFADAKLGQISETAKSFTSIFSPSHTPNRNIKLTISTLMHEKFFQKKRSQHPSPSQPSLFMPQTCRNHKNTQTGKKHLMTHEKSFFTAKYSHYLTVTRARHRPLAQSHSAQLYLNIIVNAATPHEASTPLPCPFAH